MVGLSVSFATSAISLTADTNVKIKNYINTALIEASGQNCWLCGIAGVPADLRSEEDHIYIYNSINKGALNMLSINGYIFGIIAIITQADNVVSMGQIMSKNNPESNEFWWEHKEAVTNLYQLIEDCTGQSNDYNYFTKVRDTYKTCKDSTSVADALNAQVKKQSYET